MPSQFTFGITFTCGTQQAVCVPTRNRDAASPAERPGRGPKPGEPFRLSELEGLPTASGPWLLDGESVSSRLFWPLKRLRATAILSLALFSCGG